MAGVSESRNKKPSKVVEEFSELYCKIIEKLCGTKSREFMNNVKRSLKGMRQLKHDIGKWQDKVFFAEVNFEKAETRCAYVYAYSLINTAVVYSELLISLNEKQKEFREVFSKENFNLCCLAGGPATEAVAVSKAIYDFIQKFSSDATLLFKNVNVTIVDIHPEWQTEADAVISALNNTMSLFGSRKVIFHTDFLAADLLKPFEKDLQNKISEANIVTLVKFSNAVQERSEKDCVPEMKKMLARVIKFMDYGSCLFMLDSAGGSMVNKVMTVSPSEYQLSLHKEYSLPIKPLLKMEQAIDFKRFSQKETLVPTRIGKVSSSMLIKSAVEKKAVESRKRSKALKKEGRLPAVEKKESSKEVTDGDDSCK